MNYAWILEEHGRYVKYVPGPDNKENTDQYRYGI